MSKPLLRLLAVLLALMSLPALAVVEVRGVRFADTLSVGGQSLQLNGAGVRVKVIIDVYAAALYVPRKDHSSNVILEQNGAKSVQIVLLRELTGEDFADAMLKGFRKNNSDTDNARYLPNLDAIRQHMMTLGTVRKGAVIQINHLPGIGTRAIVDGQQRGPDIPGDDFYNALLKIWLGNHPVDSGLKEDLLSAK